MFLKVSPSTHECLLLFFSLATAVAVIVPVVVVLILMVVVVVAGSVCYKKRRKKKSHDIERGQITTPAVTTQQETTDSSFVAQLRSAQVTGFVAQADSSFMAQAGSIGAAEGQTINPNSDHPLDPPQAPGVQDHNLHNGSPNNSKSQYNENKIHKQPQNCPTTVPMLRRESVDNSKNDTSLQADAKSCPTLDQKINKVLDNQEKISKL